jgi:hypothetical protein
MWDQTPILQVLLRIVPASEKKSSKEMDDTRQPRWSQLFLIAVASEEWRFHMRDRLGFHERETQRTSQLWR